MDGGDPNVRILLVHPGASWSTADIWTGLKGALERAGVELVNYALDGRIGYAGAFLDQAWRMKRKAEPDCVKYTDADVFYLASTGVLERALRFECDWAIVVSGMYIHPDAMIMLRRAGVKVALLLSESPYNDDRALPFAECADVVWVNERSRVPVFRERNPHTYYWQHAIDPMRHKRGATETDKEAATHDVVFVGTGFVERIWTLEAVDWSGIDLGLYGTWNLIGSRNRLRQHLRGPVVPNDVTAALYRRAKVGLNLHRTSVTYGRVVPHIEDAESMGPRCYELAATGCFFATDYRAEVADVFGTTVPVFHSPQELEETIRYYLAHDDERQAIADSLPGMVTSHTFDDRVAEMLSVLRAA